MSEYLLTGTVSEWGDGHETFRQSRDLLGDKEDTCCLFLVTLVFQLLSEQVFVALVFAQLSVQLCQMRNGQLVLPGQLL